jgi:transcriptional regulator with XRE-family HTH domain
VTSGRNGPRHRIHTPWCCYLIRYHRGVAVIGPRTQRSVDTWAGNVLRVARAKAGLTQRQLAVKAGVPHSTIAKIESGVRQPTHPTMAKILAAVDLSLSTRLVPYDDHDDVLWEQEQRRSDAERAQIQAEQARLVRGAT